MKKRLDGGILRCASAVLDREDCRKKICQMSTWAILCRIDLRVYISQMMYSRTPRFPHMEKQSAQEADNGFGLDHGDRIQNRGEESVQPDKDQPIDVPQPHPRPGL